jgi:ribosome recycling factor
MDSDELLLSTEERMEKALENLKEKFRGMRTGRANPGLIENIKVEYYGTQTPLRQISNISAPEADLLVVKPFDPSSLGSIEKAIQKSDVGIHPMNDGKVIRLQVPPLSQERRKQLAARAKEVAEEARISVRNVRRDANKSAEQLEKDGDLSEDDLKKLKDEIQTLVKTHEEKIDEALKVKTAELTVI